jgi:hypothetical protein
MQAEEGEEHEVWENPDIPIAETLPPPHVAPPYACTSTVTVSGAIAGAMVEVTRLPGGSLPVDEIQTAVADGQGWATVSFTTPHQDGDTFVGYQLANGTRSDPAPLVTARYRTEPLPKPVISPGVWECGRSIHQEYAANGIPILAERDGNPMNLVGGTDVPDERNEVEHTFRHMNETPAGTAGQNVVIYQNYCPEDEDHHIPGPPSDPEPISSAPNPLPALNSLDAFAGTGTVRINGAFVGERQEWDHAGNSSLTYGFAPYPYRIHFPNFVIDESSPVVVQRRLCGNVSTGHATIPIPFDETEQLLPIPTVSGPVCEAEQYLEVSTSFPGGRFVVYDNGQPVAQASAAAGFARIRIPSPKSSQLQVRQEFESGLRGPFASVAVTNGLELEVVGAASYTDQITGAIYSPAVLKEGAGIRIRLAECCATNDLPEVLVVFVEGFEVNLYRTHDGVYEGLWAFRVEGAEYPPLNTQLTIEATAPCSGEELQTSVYVVTGQVNPNDSQNPSIRIRADQPGRNSSPFINEGDTSATYLVEPGESTEVDIVGTDPDGLESVLVTHSGTGSLSNAGRTAQLQVPLPTTISHTATVSPLEPYQQATVSGQGQDFAGNTNATPQLTLVGEHMKPVINSITPDPTTAGGTITINGVHLGAATLETRVVFDAVSDSITETVVLPPGPSVSPSQLLNVGIPQPFENYIGDIDVVVVTRNLAGTEEETSSSERIEIEFVATGGSANFVPFSDFDTTTSAAYKCNGSAEPGTITGIASWSANAVFVSSEGRPNKRITFTTKPGTSAGSGIGGVYIPENCRNVFVFSYDGSNGAEESWTFTGYYFPPTGDVLDDIETGISRQHYAPGSPDPIINYADYAVFAGSTDDGSVIFLQNAALNPTNSTPPVYGHIWDMYPSPAKTRSSGPVSCPSVASCTPSASVSNDGSTATMSPAGVGTLSTNL